MRSFATLMVAILVAFVAGLSLGRDYGVDLTGYIPFGLPPPGCYRLLAKGDLDNEYARHYALIETDVGELRAFWGLSPYGNGVFFEGSTGQSFFTIETQDRLIIIPAIPAVPQEPGVVNQEVDIERLCEGVQ